MQTQSHARGQTQMQTQTAKARTQAARGSELQGGARVAWGWRVAARGGAGWGGGVAGHLTCRQKTASRST